MLPIDVYTFIRADTVFAILQKFSGQLKWATHRMIDSLYLLNPKNL